VPVYEQTYTHYEGVYRPRSLAWLIIAGRGIRKVWKAKGFKFPLFFSLSVFLISAVRIYLAANLDLLQYMGFPREMVEDILVIDASFYHDFLMLQSTIPGIFACFLMTLLSGSSVIAIDKRTKALALYLSKPISRLDYLFGKGAIVLFYLYLVTLIPALLLMFLYAFFNENWYYLWANRELIFQIVLFSHVVVLPLVFLILAISASTKSKVTAGVMFCVVYFMPFTTANILRGMMRHPLIEQALGEHPWSVLSLQHIWNQLSAVIFKTDLPYEELHWGWHVGTLVLVMLLCVWILRRQIQAVEIVR